MRRRIPTNEVLEKPESTPKLPASPKQKPETAPVENESARRETANLMASMTDAEDSYDPTRVIPTNFSTEAVTGSAPPAPSPRRHITDATQRGFASIVAFVYSIDLSTDFDRIKGQLRLDRPPSQSDYGTLVDALDTASENARLAIQVLSVAKTVHDGMVANAEALTAPLYSAAKDKLQEQKNAGVITKQITNGDVEMMAVRMFPAELNARAEQQSQAKRTVEYLEGLAQRWGERCRDLRQMVAGARNV